MNTILDWMNPTRWIILGLLVLALIAAGWRVHHNIWTAGYDAARSEYAVQAQTVNAKREEVTAPIALKFAKRADRIVTVTKEIIKEVPVYVSANDCPMSPGFRVFHDAAANGEFPDPARIADAAAVPADALANTVADNYGTCLENANRLTGLQEWVRAQQNLTR